MRYQTAKKPTFNADYINDLDSFTSFLVGDILYNNKTVYLECSPDLMPIIRKKFDSMSQQHCFSIKDSGRKNLNYYFLLDNINERALNRCLDSFGEMIEFYEQKKFIDEMSISKTSCLIPKRLKFNSRKSIIESEIGNCSIPSASREYDFCMVMLKYAKNKPVEWTVIHDKMIGDDLSDNFKKNKKMIRDAMSRINKRVRKSFKIKENLFSFERKHIKRNF